ncbi:MAG: glycosyltransferase family 39 protein [Bacteroidales bacterium]|nr:glycosyltransferase family 39 protein [Bacteroidales bacterium]
MKNKTVYLALLIIFFLLALFQNTHNIGKEPVKIWDEASSAQNAIEMMESGHYFIVYHDGKPTHENDTKPPVNLWFKVFSYKVFGINEFAVRFPTILSSIGIMLMLILFAWRYLKRQRMAVLLILLIGITPGYMGYHVARHGDPDTLLLFFVTAYILLFFYIFYEYPKVKNRYYVLLALAVALAGLTKSIAGFAPAVGLVLFAFTQKKFYRMLSDKKIHYTWISALLLFAAYYLIREAFDPNYIKDSILRELSLAKSYPYEPKHPEFSFYFKYLWETGFYPFLYIIPLAIIPWVSSQNKMVKKLLLYSFFGAFFFVLGNSLSVTKNEWYIAPAYPYLWLFTAATLDMVLSFLHKQLAGKKLLWYSAVVIFVLAVAYFYVQRFQKIHDKNQIYQEVLYHPEREGAFLDVVKDSIPEIKEMTIYTNQQWRQMKFYIKKYRYLDGTSVDIKEEMDSTFMENPVLCAQKKLIEDIESRYDYEVIMEGKYGKLYNLQGIKKKPEARPVEKDQ